MNLTVIDMDHERCVRIVGPHASGKTALGFRLAGDQKCEPHVGVIDHNSQSTVLSFNDELFKVFFNDVETRNDQMNRLRPLSYINADLFLLCFDVNSAESFAELSRVWIPELRHHQPTVPIVLLATKVDVVEENADREPAVSDSEMRELVDQFKLDGLAKVSAFSCSGLSALNDVVAELASQHISSQTKQRQKILRKHRKQSFVKKLKALF